MTARKPILQAAGLLVAAVAMAGCSSTAARLGEVGKPPQMERTRNPTKDRAYQHTSMPMPKPKKADPSPNSLWRPGARAFFQDQRANQVGDIVTVNVQIDDNAAMSNETSRSRDSSENAGVDKLLGYEAAADRLLPEEVTPGDLADFNSSTETDSTGEIDRTETVETTVAAVITQVLPNGNLTVFGRQQVRVNHEMRNLVVSGVVRPQDISNSNTVDSDKIAEARIAYGGRGTLSNVQQPGWGQQVFDVVYPF